MKKLRLFWKNNQLMVLAIGLSLFLLTTLLLYKLGDLTNNRLSYAEWQASTTAYGWYGLFHDPFYLPLKAVRSIAFLISGNHSAYLIRLPNVILGALTVAMFAGLIRLWHGNRTAILSTILFATAAWVLHVSRLASYDVLYLMLIPALLLSIAAMQRRATNAFVFYGSLLVWGALLYLPGAVWLVALTVFWERRAIKLGWQHFKSFKQRFLYVLSGLIWLPLLIIELTKSGMLKLWLGLPQHLATPINILKQLWEVIFNITIHGPSNASVWLPQAPIFDIFTLVMAGLGIYFYAKHWRVGRARILLSFFLVGTVLIALSGPVSFSLIVPLMYICVATGIAYLIHEWLQVFPINPFARILGISLVVLAISLSCLYNLRAYYIAWPHNTSTEATFHYKP